MTGNPALSYNSQTATRLSIFSSHIFQLTICPRIIPTENNFCVCLLDKSEGEEFSGKFDKAWNTLKEYSDCLGIEVSERVNISNMLAACLAQQAQELARVQQDMKV